MVEAAGNAVTVKVMQNAASLVSRHADAIATAYLHAGPRGLSVGTHRVRVREGGGDYVISLRDGDRPHVVTVSDRLLELYCPPAWRGYSYAMLRVEVERLGR